MVILVFIVIFMIIPFPLRIKGDILLDSYVVFILITCAITVRIRVPAIERITAAGELILIQLCPNSLINSLVIHVTLAAVFIKCNGTFFCRGFRFKVCLYRYILIYHSKISIRTASRVYNSDIILCSPPIKYIIIIGCCRKHYQCII